jgi:citrate synthase
MSAKDASTYLGVSMATLYAYVSRKNIRTTKADNSKSSMYWTADIVRVKNEKYSSQNVSTGLSDLTTGSSITLITEDSLYYRGHDAINLASTNTIEEVAEKLWNTDGVFQNPTMATPNEFDKIIEVYKDFSLVEKALAVFPLLERSNPKAYDLSKEGFQSTSADVVRWITALLLGESSISSAPLHQVISKKLKLCPTLEDLVRKVVILSMDHELDPTTYCVRAAANTWVTPYSAVVAGLIAFSGRRLAYGKVNIVGRFINEINSSNDPREIVLQRFKNGETMVGFESSLHNLRDPRAVYLWSEFQTAFENNNSFRNLKIVIEMVKNMSGEAPSFMLLICYLSTMLGFGHQNVGIAGVGRSVGWLAHASEQMFDKQFVRPRTKYTGPLPY